MTKTTVVQKIFSRGRWIWDESDRLQRDYFLRAQHTFNLAPSTLKRSAEAKLAITADAYYQIWLNGKVLGHGPAKSPEGERMVDVYPISGYLQMGKNTLEVLAQGLGYGTMNYCLGEAGLIFELRLPGKIVASGSQTLVSHDDRFRSGTIRRWIMPGIEDFTAGNGRCKWRPARVVEKTDRLISRPVSLPTREPISPQRFVTLDLVRFPPFSISFRIKPYLVDAVQRRRQNLFQTPAFIVTDLISTQDQELALVPTAGKVVWYFDNKKIIAGEGLHLWDEAGKEIILRLKKGSNRLIGVLGINHFEEIHLAGFVSTPIHLQNPFGEGGFQIVPAADEPLVVDEVLSTIYEDLVKRGTFPKMNPTDALSEANFQDLAVNAKIAKANLPDIDVLQIHDVWKLPATKPGEAVRLIVDLGAVRNGWLSFSVHGKKDSRLIFSLFEALEYGPPLRINWPEAINNAVSYRLKDGEQSFESFFAYGGRYIAIHHEGPHPVEVQQLRLLAANCGGLRRGAFRSDDLMLNAIYAICEQTVHSATDDSLTDCPTYEAVNWNFDNRLGAMADLVTFRNLDLLRNTIEIYARDPQYLGLVRSHYPSAWESRIPVFSFHWIILCHEFFLATGDRAFVQRIFPQVARGLEEALKMINETGLMHWPQEEKPWHIIDWHSQRDDNYSRVSAEQAILLGAIAAGKSLAGVVSEVKMKAHVRRWGRAETKLRTAIHRHFWVPKRDAYADSIHEDGTLSAVSSQPSNCALAYYGVGTEVWRKRLALRISKGGKGLLIFGSPMGLFYIMEFLDQAGEVETIFRLIREKWSPMVLSGDGTTWEHFPEYGQPRFPTRSRCHPFATFILKYYVKYLLGLEPIGVGTRRFRFKPRPPTGLEMCEGVIPTELGSVRVKWKRRGKDLQSQIEIPAGIYLKKK